MRQEKGVVEQVDGVKVAAKDVNETSHANSERRRQRKGSVSSSVALYRPGSAKRPLTPDAVYVCPTILPAEHIVDLFPLQVRSLSVLLQCNAGQPQSRGRCRRGTL